MADVQREIDIPDSDVSPLEEGAATNTRNEQEMQSKVDKLVAQSQSARKQLTQTIVSKTASAPRDQTSTAAAAAGAATPGAASSIASPPPKPAQSAAASSAAPTASATTSVAISSTYVKPIASVNATPNAAGMHGGIFAVPDWVRLHPTVGAYFAEIIGTFIFVLTIALVEVNNPTLPGQKDTNTSPIPIGFTLTVMVFTFGYISGGHFNPAVSLAVTVAKNAEFGYVRCGIYMACQVGAALGAGIVAMIIQGTNDIIVPDVNNDADYIRKGLFAELIYTFALATVVLNVAYSRQKENFFYGFAIGFIVISGASAVGGVSGGAFNPAVATGLQAAVCIVGRCTALMHFWLYWVAPCLGAIFAGLLFSAQWEPEAALEGNGDRVIR